MADPTTWTFGSRFEIPHLDHPEQTYLTRWRLIGTPWCSLYLHKIATPDSRPTLHDHPWSFISLILTGGYDEIRLDPIDLTPRRRRRRWLNVMRRDDAHYIARLHNNRPCWTLLLVGRRRRTWGYWRYQKGGHWIWTAFDRDCHAIEFDTAMRRRSERAA